MKKHFSTVSQLIAVSLAVCLFGVTLLGNNSNAQSMADYARQSDLSPYQQIEVPAKAEKVSPDLRDLMSASEPGEGYTTQASKEETAKVIVQFRSAPRASLAAFLNRYEVKVKSAFENFNSKMLELPVSMIKDLAAFKEVTYISLDRNLEMLGHIEITTGAYDMRRLSGNSGLDGRGVGIAVIDSGIYSNHNAFKDRIQASVDFTGQSGATRDPYGHGTHVAGLAGGASGDGISGAYEGIAPAANLINLRVLDAQGRGTTSALLNALDWVMTNRTRYNIRVVNMSLGSLAVDSYINDPVCRAVRRLVDAGVVCVVAAGNNGKDNNGQKIYGLIHSPGNEPSAITVGAANTYGTNVRSDDTIATYSSRGPTRSYWTDTAGQRHYDNLIKPDLVAPGNRLISAQADNNLLVLSHPELDATITTDEKKDMMYLSGTSMATPVVAGAAALILQANPSLTPNLVKVILMCTAQPIAGFNMFEQGAGELNIEGAIRLAKLVRTNLTNNTLLGSPLLITNTPPATWSTIAGQSFDWSQGILTNYSFVTGLDLIMKYQRVYGAGMLISDGLLVADGHLLSNTIMLTDGVQVGEGVITSNGHLLSNGTLFMASGHLLSNTILTADGLSVLADGVVMSDGQLMSDGHLLSNTTVLGETIAQSNESQVNGDSGGMEPDPDQ
jgi:serine protease AprX